MARRTAVKPVKTASKTIERTTRTGIINVVVGNNILFHFEVAVKAPKSEAELVTALYEQVVKYGNLDKLPKGQKEPLAVKVAGDTTVYVAVLLYPAKQCGICGTFGKSDYCPACRGEVLTSDSLVSDL